MSAVVMPTAGPAAAGKSVTVKAPRPVARVGKVWRALRPLRTVLCWLFVAHGVALSIANFVGGDAWFITADVAEWWAFAQRTFGSGS